MDLTKERGLVMPRKSVQRAVLNDIGSAVQYLDSVWDKGTINTIESIYVLYLNYRDEVIDYHLLNTGNESTVTVNIEAILRTAISQFARSVIIAHNHPSGDTDPSIADVKTTELIMRSCRVLGIHFKDHIIVSPRSNAYSFKKAGLMKEIASQCELSEQINKEGSYANIAFNIADKFCSRIMDKYSLRQAQEMANRELEKLYIKFFDPII